MAVTATSALREARRSHETYYEIQGLITVADAPGGAEWWTVLTRTDRVEAQGLLDNMRVESPEKTFILAEVRTETQRDIISRSDALARRR